MGEHPSTDAAVEVLRGDAPTADAELLRHHRDRRRGPRCACGTPLRLPRRFVVVFRVVLADVGGQEEHAEGSPQQRHAPRVDAQRFYQRQAEEDDEDREVVGAHDGGRRISECRGDGRTVGYFDDSTIESVRRAVQSEFPSASSRVRPTCAPRRGIGESAGPYGAGWPRPDCIGVRGGDGGNTSYPSVGLQLVLTLPHLRLGDSRVSAAARPVPCRQGWAVAKGGPPRVRAQPVVG